MIDKRCLFPAALLLANFGAAAVSFRAGDWKRGSIDWDQQCGTEQRVRIRRTSCVK